MQAARALAFVVLWAAPSAFLAGQTASATIAWSGPAGGRRTGSLEIRMSTAPLLPLVRNRSAVLRVTVVVVQKNGREGVFHRIVSGYESVRRNVLVRRPHRGDGGVPGPHALAVQEN